MSASVGHAREPRDLQRSVGGLLVAVGALVVLIRSSGAPHWTEFERVLVIAVPVVLLYALAVGRRSASEASGPPREAAPWRAVLLVTAVLLSPIALLALLHWLGVDTNKWSVQAAVAVAAALAGFAGARRARAPYGMLIAGIALLVAWLIVWSKIVDHPSAGDFRWFLVAGAVMLFAAAAGLAASGSLGVGEITIAGAIAAVLAGAIGVVVGGFASLAVLAVGSIHGAGGETTVTSEGGTPNTPPGSLSVEHVHRSGLEPNLKSLFGNHGPLGIHSGLQHFGWDLYLLVVSLLLVWVGSRLKARGLGYVGAVGLLAFTFSVGTQIARLEGGHLPSHSLLGWPVVLVALGLLALVAPAVSARRR